MEYIRIYLDAVGDPIHLEIQEEPFDKGIIEETSDPPVPSRIATIWSIEVGEIELTQGQFIAEAIAKSDLTGIELAQLVTSMNAASLAKGGKRVESRVRDLFEYRFSDNGTVQKIQRLRRARKFIDTLENDPGGSVKFKASTPAEEQTTISNVQSVPI